MASAPPGSFGKAEPNTFWLSIASRRYQEVCIASGVNPIEPQGRADVETIIQRELRSIDRVRRALLGQQNALRPLCRFPPEILSYIFSLVDWRPGHHSIFYHGSSISPICSPIRLGWIVVTHVCRRWRQVALASATLWSTIDFKLGAKWAMETLTRSRKCPIFYHVDEGDPLQYHKAILPRHLSHIKSLTMHEQSNAVDVIASECVAPAPILESFHCHRYCEDPDAPVAVCLPVNLFAGHAPRLRIMKLDNVVPSWACTAFSNLEHLSISSPMPELPSNAAPIVHPEYELFYDFLERMPGLRQLSLQWCFPSRHDHPTVDRRVKFPNLTHIEVNGLAGDCGAMLRRIELAPDATFLVHFVVAGATDLDIVESMEGLACHMRSVDDARPPIHTLRVANCSSGEYDVEVEFEAWRESTRNIHEHLSLMKVHPPIRAIFCADNEAPERFQTVFTQAMRVLPLDKTETLSFSPYPFWTPQTAAQVGSYMPSALQHLLFDVELDPHLSRVLIAPVDGTPALPRLKTLSFVSITMAITATAAKEEKYLLPLEIVTRRQRQYTPLEKVCLSRCPYTPEVIRELEACVPVEHYPEHVPT
ncbi:hypothetical protein OF83DRAFT_625709 [Amylostereum chailletii]|nr:hypothetical protein OF83DRAFT_625709 [Amylostereum chailletii]